MPEYRTLYTIAYEHLRSMIYSGGLEFNRIYSETKLAAELSISRTPIRDALNRLSSERVIDILPNRGFMLHRPTQADIFEAYHIRLMIEGYCAEIVARHYPDPRARATIDRMEEALVQQQQLLEDGAAYDLGQFWLDDLKFHRSLLEYMNISSLFTQYESFMHVFRPHHLIEGGGVLERHRSSIMEHSQITEALKSHDVERVRQSIRTHIDSSLRVMYEHLEGQHHSKAD